MKTVPLIGLADMPRPRVASLSETIATWQERQRFRRNLREMSDANPHLLADIGLSRRQVEAEIAKPFWQA